MADKMFSFLGDLTGIGKDKEKEEEEERKKSDPLREMEDMPLMGYGAAIAYAATGKQDEARRAAAKCTNATVSSAADCYASGQKGVKKELYSAVGDTAGIAAESKIAEGIKDDKVRKDCKDLKTEDIMKPALLMAGTVATKKASD